MRKVVYKYSHYRGTVSNTVPGRCYSIQELLNRVLRGQPLPMVPPQMESTREVSDEEIDHALDNMESHPFYDRDADIIEAKNALESINEKERVYESTKNKKTSKKAKQ